MPVNQCQKKRAARKKQMPLSEWPAGFPGITSLQVLAYSMNMKGENRYEQNQIQQTGHGAFFKVER